MNEHPPSLKSLQAGRAFAATAVAAFHLSLMMGEPRYGGDAVFAGLTQYGYLGVDFFFVLSGFIIFFVHQCDLGRPDALRSYLRRRVVRLFPIYWLYTGVFVLLLATGLGTATALPSSAIDFVTSFTLIRFSDADPPLSVAWTLFHEVAFYALFGLLIVHIRAGLAAFALWAILCLVFFHQVPRSHANAFDTYLAASNFYFLFGIGAYYLYRRGGSGKLEMLGGLGLIAASLASLSSMYDLARIGMGSGFALVLTGTAKLESAGKLAFPRWAVYMGDASYSIYLLHLALSGLLLKILIKMDLRVLLGSTVIYWIVLAATLALGCLAYATVEKPLLAKFGRGTHRRAAVKLPNGQGA